MAALRPTTPAWGNPVAAVTGVSEAGQDRAAHRHRELGKKNPDGSLDLNPLCGVGIMAQHCVPDDVGASPGTFRPRSRIRDSGLPPDQPGSSAQAGAAGTAGEGSGGFSSSLGGDAGFGVRSEREYLAGDGGASQERLTERQPRRPGSCGCQVQRSTDAQQSVVSHVR